MTPSSLFKPALYDVDPSRSGHAILRGGRCICGHVFFPMQTYGCEKCGRAGEDLQPTILEGRGELVASVTVHMHARSDRKAPFTIGTIRLKEGPVLRTLLSGPVAGLKPGCPMHAILVPAVSDGSVLDLRFEQQTD